MLSVIKAANFYKTACPNHIRLSASSALLTQGTYHCVYQALFFMFGQAMAIHVSRQLYDLDILSNGKHLMCPSQISTCNPKHDRMLSKIIRISSRIQLINPDLFDPIFILYITFTIRKPFIRPLII